jgi:hypothetical protein
MSHSYPGRAANTASYPALLHKQPRLVRDLCNRIESVKKAFTFETRFVYYASFVAGA